MAETAGKVCSVCGIDVASRPRVKDAAGRYLCQDCFKKVQATRGAQKAPSSATKPAAAPTSPSPDDDNSLVLQLGSGTMAEKGTRPCPECGRALPHDAVLCTNCGMNFQTGKRMSVKVVKAKGEKAAKSRSASGDSLMSNPHVVGVAVVIAWCIFAGMVVAMPDLYLLFGIALGIYTIVVGICVLVAIWSEAPLWAALLLGFRIGGRGLGRMAAGSGEEGLVLAGLIEIGIALLTLFIVFTKVESVLLRWLWSAGIFASILLPFVNPKVLEQISGG